MKILDNITNTVRDDLRVEIKKGSRVSIAAACFSMYAYKELKKQLETIDEFEFIFTSPTFVKEKAEKQKREFYIPRISRETSLYGTEFEIKLRNEMTQRAIAKECADWIRRKATFKSNTTGENMAGFMTVDSGAAQTAYMPIGGFTTVDIGCERGNNSYNMVNCMEAPFAQQYMKLFDTLWNDRDKMQDVTDVVLENISTAYAENSPEFIYFMTLYHVFSEFLDDISEDELPNEATGFKQSKIWSLLYDFQKDAVLAIINKLEKYNGCILADSVGLGKTFTALAVVKYYENRNKSVLVLCPKKLAENWNTYKDNYVNNPIASDRLNYDVLFHTDLSRSGGKSNGLDLDRLNWGNYDLVVIDESHNFRNGIGTHSKTQDNRYQRLMDKVIRAGVKTKVLMLSATPVNNRFVDLKNQLALAYEGSSEYLDEKLNTSKSIEDIFKQAQKAFNAWSKLKPEERTTDALLRTLDFDFFELLDSVTIARSRKHIMLLRDEKVLNAQCDGFEALLRDRSISELDIKRYIQNNKYYHIPASIFSNYTFGHHEAVLFKEFPLGTQYVVDYLLAGRASGGWQFIFVEFENPYNNIVVKDGDWGMTVRKGLKQIRDWQAFIAANYAVLYEEFKKYTPKILTEEFFRYDPTRMHYAVVAGRRQDFDDPAIRVLQRQLKKESDIKLLHYDNLLDDSRRLIGMSSY